MGRGVMGVSCLSCVAKPCGQASGGGPRRRYPKASKCGSRTKGRKGISAVPNVQNIRPRIQSIPTPHSLWPPLLQTRVNTLNGELGEVFKRWYPDMQVEELAEAA